MKFRFAVLCASVLLLCACSSVPFDHPKSGSTAIATDHNSHWGKDAVEWQSRYENESGFVSLHNGVEALGVRIELMERAQSSIDAQYFIIKDDLAGAIFVGSLLRAADNGVRVRLLVDDIFSPGVDEPFSLLNNHPNVEVRLFNPISRQGLKYVNYLWDFKRANRRMHNKAFIVDNALAIVGGRNIGEEYFDLKQSVKFDDFEVLTIGPVVNDISTAFDSFWNSDLAVPVEAFQVEADTARLDEWRAYMTAQATSREDSVYWQALNSTFIGELKSGLRKAFVAPATLVSDSPEKLQHEVGNVDMARLGTEFGRRLRAANKEVLIITPYFIPQDDGVDLLKDLLARDVAVTIVTNSLSSTNHVPVYSSYQGYRRRLLEAGASFYEIRARDTSNETAWGHTPESKTLHSKFSIIDQATVMIGSLNFDPRSFLLNSEMALFVESPESASTLREAVQQNFGSQLYKVELDANSNMRWTYEDEGQTHVLHKSPDTSWWRRMQVRFYGLLPIESQL